MTAITKDMIMTGGAMHEIEAVPYIGGFWQREYQSPCVECVINEHLHRPNPIICSQYVADCRAHKREDNQVVVYKIKTENKETEMKIKKSRPKVGRQRAIEIAMNHNNVSRTVAENYTTSELKEVLKQLKISANY